MNSTYSKTLPASLPMGLKQAADEATMASLGNSRVLLSQSAMVELEGTFKKMGGDGEMLFPKTVQAIRTSMEAGLRSVFWISAITMLLSFFIILTLPEISLDSEAQDNSSSESKTAVGS
jgi:hypothetical protein